MDIPQSVHTHSPWGTQIGIDLFNASFVGIYFANVQSRQYGFRAWPYVLLTLCTGSPGVLALGGRVGVVAHVDQHRPQVRGNDAFILDNQYRS